jgi:hypothetical protein
MRTTARTAKMPKDALYVIYTMVQGRSLPIPLYIKDPKSSLVKHALRIVPARRGRR